MVKLDKKDRLLLYELDKNSRQTHSQLSKKVRIKQETVRYRINNFTKEGIIKNFFTIIDVSKLGKIIYKILLKLHNVDEKKKKEIMGYLVKNNLVLWVADTYGVYDIALTIGTDSLIKAKEFLAELYKVYGKFLQNKEISVNISGEYLTRDYLVNKKRVSEKNADYYSDTGKSIVDERDVKILKELAKNSRVSIIEIATKLEISSDTVIQRIKKMEKNQVITKYNIFIDNAKIGQIHYKVFLYFNNLSSEKEKELYSYCKSIPKIIYIIKAFGSWDLELDLEVESVEEFRRIMMDLTSKFSSMIKDYSALTIYNVHKYNLLP